MNNMVRVKSLQLKQRCAHCSVRKAGAERSVLWDKLSTGNGLSLGHKYKYYYRHYIPR